MHVKPHSHSFKLPLPSQTPPFFILSWLFLEPSEPAFSILKREGVAALDPGCGVSEDRGPEPVGGSGSGGKP